MRTRWFGYWVTMVAAAASLLAYPSLPARVAIHFNTSGQPDGYAPRLAAVALVPLMMLGMCALFAVLPRIDPKRENYRKFGDTYWIIVNGVLLFMAAVHGAMLAYGLGVPLGIHRVMAVGLGVLLLVLGNYLARVEPNWFVGIRTPWTLSSEQVWHRTHRVGGRLFVVGGLLCVLTVFVPAPAALALIVGITLVVAIVPVVISYVLWKQEGH